jgi:trans-aconitate 2-methyltransferase
MTVTCLRHEPVSYAFGDSDIAARRLEILSRVFARTTRAFLERTALPCLGLAVDLGCGPGHSTRFLADGLPAEHVAGIDNSEHFIALAQSRATDRVSFHLHDFTCTPFPVGPADLLYARFELSHMKDPGSLIERWTTQLRPGGLLLMEETEWIHTSHPAFRAYLEIVEAMLASQGMKLYVGHDLVSLPDTPALQRRASDLRQFHVRDRYAAIMFSLNIRTWKHHPYVQAGYPSAMIEQLEADLEALTRRAGESSEIEWGLRQLVFERI